MNSNTPHIFVVGNEKGGAGKTTYSMHLIAGLLEQGFKVGSIDVDSRQSSLTSYIENRQNYNSKNSASPVPCSTHFHLEPKSDSESIEELEDILKNKLNHLDYVVIDTPGSYTNLSKTAHSYADTVITPINDSFLDVDVLAKIDPNSFDIISPSIYSQNIWEQKMERAKRDGKSIKWFVLRNRLSNLDAINKRNVAKVLDKLSKRLGFMVLPGFSERVIFRELFLQGLSLLDLANSNYYKSFNISHVAARQEVRNFLNALEIRAV